MPLLSFSVLKNKLLDGSKTQTIRVPRKHPLKVGDKLYIYWKCRTKETEKLGEGVITEMHRKTLAWITNDEAKKDGFEDTKDSFAIHNLALAFKKLHPEGNEFSIYDIITWKWTQGGPLQFKNTKEEKSL